MGVGGGSVTVGKLGGVIVPADWQAESKREHKAREQSTRLRVDMVFILWF
jgi:hypothetical protein